MLVAQDSDFSGYFAETWDVETVEYTDGLVLEGPAGASAYQWNDLLSEICVVYDDDEEAAGLNSVSDDETILDGAVDPTYSPVLDDDVPMHYYGCVTDEGDSVIYQVYKKQTYIGKTDIVDAGLTNSDSVTIYPQLHYDQEDEYYPSESYLLLPGETGIYRFTSQDEFAQNSLGGYTDPVAYLYDEEWDLIGTYDGCGDDEDNNFDFTFGLEEGRKYYLDLGYCDFGGDVDDDYYCDAYGTYPVTIDRITEHINFPQYFKGTWNVTGVSDTNNIALVAPVISTDYQWYDLGTEITTLYDDDNATGYDSVSDDPTILYGEKDYVCIQPIKSNELIHYYGCDTADGTRMIYEVLSNINVTNYMSIPLSGTCTVNRNSITFATNGRNYPFELKPAVSGRCTIVSLDPYANDINDYYADPLMIVRDRSGNQIARDDDSGTGVNFIVSFRVNAGTSYLITPTYSYHSYDLAGSYPFRVIFTADPKPVVVTERITIAKTPSSVKAKASKGKVTVTWKKFKQTKKTKAIWKSIKKIQVQYSTDATFRTGVVTKTLGKSKTKLDVKKLKAKTTYYFRVRYVGNGGYSRWSSVKKVKAK